MSGTTPGIECLLRFLDRVDNAVFAAHIAWSGHHGDRLRRMLFMAAVCLPVVVILSG